MGNVELAPETDWDLNLSHNRAPVCPYCGHLYIDAWEIYFDGLEAENEIACAHCKEEYIVARSVEVTYSTRKKEPEAGQSPSSHTDTPTDTPIPPPPKPTSPRRNDNNLFTGEAL